MTEDDLADLEDAIEALEAARDALKACMARDDAGERERFVFQLGYARGRLYRIFARIYERGER